MSVKIPKVKNSKFVLIIGDNGAILTFMEGRKLQKRLFAPTPSLSDRREMSTLIARYPNVPVNILLDTMEQSYTQQSLPAVSALSIGKLVKKRLERDFSETDIKGAIPLGRSDSGRRDWQYMFVSSPLNTNITEWINFATMLPNPFGGIYMLPVEMESFQQRLRGSLLAKGESHAEWELLITHNKTGGFRQVVFKNKRVVFTRLVRPGKDTSADIVAGSIEQETLNTLDYLRRLSFEETDKIDITIVVAGNIKKSLEGTNFRNNRTHLLTPNDCAKFFTFKNAVSQDDKYSDILLACHFSSSKPVFKFFNPDTKRLNNLLLIYNWSFRSMLAIVPLVILYCLYLGYSIFSSSSQLTDVEDEKALIEKKWIDARKTDEYDIDDANKITDAITIHSSLRERDEDPFRILRILANAKQEDALVTSINWRINGDKKVEAIFNMQFVNTGSNIEELFKNFDTFIYRFKNQFSEFDMTNTRLPDRITFKESSNSLPVQVKVVSRK